MKGDCDKHWEKVAGFVACFYFIQYILEIFQLFVVGSPSRAFFGNCMKKFRFFISDSFVIIERVAQCDYGVHGVRMVLVDDKK